MSYLEIADSYAEKYHIDPQLFRALVKQESDWNPNAVSPVGAQGLTQIMPDTGRDPGFGVRPVNIDSTDDQLRFGAEYLSKMLDRYDGDVDRALAAYNWGAGNADKWSGDRAHLPAETRDYINKISGGAPRAQSYAELSASPPETQEQPSADWFGGSTEDQASKLASIFGLSGKQGAALGDALQSFGGAIAGGSSFG